MALISSTFDTDAEGWTVYGDAQGASALPTYVSGYIRATDDVAGGTWYWKAPASFIGNQSASLGLALSFDLRQSAIDSQAVLDDVTLDGLGIRLRYRFDYTPGTDWTHFSVNFDAEAGWWNRTANRPATLDELRGVLGSLDALMIRGEYRIGADTGSLDNVQLQSNLTRGTAAADTIGGDQFVANSLDILYGLDGNDTLAGGGGADRLYGGRGNDSIAGDAGADRIQGDAGNDTLAGSTGNDRLSGGRGSDTLSGGTGNDVFDFDSATDSATGNGRDRITDFDAGDRIDLAGIDADATLDGNQAFGGLTVGTGFSNNFAQPGELYFNLGTGTLYGNTDADPQADFSIRIVLNGIATLTAADFVL